MKKLLLALGVLTSIISPEFNQSAYAMETDYTPHITVDLNTTSAKEVKDSVIQRIDRKAHRAQLRADNDVSIKEYLNTGGSIALFFVNDDGKEDAVGVNSPETLAELVIADANARPAKFLSSFKAACDASLSLAPAGKQRLFEVVKILKARDFKHFNRIGSSVRNPKDTDHISEAFPVFQNVPYFFPGSCDANTIDAIILDDVDKVQSKFCTTTFSSIDCFKYISLIAKCGAVKCFKYFMLSSGFDMKCLDSKKQEQLINYALGGGNVEIIHILEQNGLFEDFDSYNKDGVPTIVLGALPADLCGWMLIHNKLNGFDSKFLASVMINHVNAGHFDEARKLIGEQVSLDFLFQPRALPRAGSVVNGSTGSRIMRDSHNFAVTDFGAFVLKNFSDRPEVQRLMTTKECLELDLPPEYAAVLKPNFGKDARGNEFCPYLFKFVRGLRNDKSRHDVFACLIANGANLNFVMTSQNPQHNFTLLDTVCCERDAELIKCLVDNGAKLSGTVPNSDKMLTYVKSICPDKNDSDLVLGK